VENKGKLILTEIFPLVQEHGLEVLIHIECCIFHNYFLKPGSLLGAFQKE